MTGNRSLFCFLSLAVAACSSSIADPSDLSGAADLSESDSSALPGADLSAVGAFDLARADGNGPCIDPTPAALLHEKYCGSAGPASFCYLNQPIGGL